jgi:hypothetical protein
MTDRVAPKVLIGVPALDRVHTEFAISLAALACESARRGIHIRIEPVIHFTIKNAHAHLVENAQAFGATHLFLVETDNAFPKDALARLLAHDKDIVGSTYLTRSEPHVPMGMTTEGRAPDVSGGGLRPMNALPMGVTLIDMAVFGKMEQPWWREPYMAEVNRFATDDYDFCNRARELGFEVWLDATLAMETGHIGQVTWKLSDDAAIAGDPWGRPVSPVGEVNMLVGAPDKSAA